MNVTWTTFLSQALSVALTVTGLLWLTRRGGGVIAGLATAALSAPTLVLLGQAQGAAFAREAALGTWLSTPVCAWLAALGMRWLRGQAATVRTPWPGQWLCTVLLAGTMSAGVCALAHQLGALGSGLIGGLPVVAAWTMLGTRSHLGATAAQHYLGAYRRGLGARGVMNLVFAAGATTLGVYGAMALALLVSVLAARVSGPGAVALSRAAAERA